MQTRDDEAGSSAPVVSVEVGSGAANGLHGGGGGKLSLFEALLVAFEDALKFGY